MLVATFSILVCCLDGDFGSTTPEKLLGCAQMTRYSFAVPREWVQVEHHEQFVVVIPHGAAADAGVPPMLPDVSLLVRERDAVAVPVALDRDAAGGPWG